MLEITKGNTSFDLPEDIAMSFEWNSPILDNEVIQGEFSMPVKLPFTAKNLKELNFANVLNNRSKWVSLEGCDVSFEGINFVSGKLKILQVSNAFEASLLSGAGGVASELKNTKLADLDLGGNRNVAKKWIKEEAVPAHGNNVSDFEAFSGNFSYSVPWAGSDTQTLQNLIDEINANNDEFCTAELIGNNHIKYTAKVPGSDMYAAMTTYLIENSVVNLFTLIFSVNSNNLEEDGLFANMDSVVDLSFPAADYAFPVLYNESFYDGADSSLSAGMDFSGYSNYYFNGAYHGNNFSNTKFNCLPLPYLHYVLTKIANKVGYTISGSIYENPELRKLIIYNTYALDAYGFIDAGTGNAVSKFYHIINLKNHVPDITIGELLNALRNFFCAAILFDSKANIIEVIPCKEILSSTDISDYTDKTLADVVFVEDLPDGFTLKSNPDSADKYFSERVKEIDETRLLPSVPTEADLPLTETVLKIRLVEDVDQYFIYNKDGWEFFSENIQDYKAGAGEKKFETDISTLLNIRQTDEVNTSRSWLVPCSKQEGNSPGFRLAKSDFSPRLLFYRGRKQDSAGNYYPLAGSDILDYSGSPVGEYSLFWHGDNGLYQKWWKEWIRFMGSTRKVSANVKLTAADLKNFSWKKKIRIGNCMYLPAKLSFTVTKRKISTVKMELLKL